VNCTFIFFANSIYSYDLIEVIWKDQTCVKMARFFDFPRKMRRFVSMGWVEKRFVLIEGYLACFLVLGLTRRREGAKEERIWFGSNSWEGGFWLGVSFWVGSHAKARSRAEQPMVRRTRSSGYKSNLDRSLLP
jgi:hypothetical protein